MPRNRIPTLDGWRAVAIAAVMLSHGFLLRGAATRPVRAFAYAAAHAGATGVALFFAISGYLITTLLLEERALRGRISLRGFYRRRAFRILPPAYAYLGVIALAGTYGGLAEPLRWGELVSAAGFYSNYWGPRSWYTAHFWSLSMEEHFYLLWPAVLVFAGNRRALLTAGMVIAATTFWRPWSLAHWQASLPALQRTDMRLDAFLFACALAILLQGPRCRPLLRLLTAAWFRASSALILIAAWIWSLVGPTSASGMLVETAVLPAIVVSVVYGRRGPLFRCLECAPVRWVGGISYGLYLWQPLFFTPEPGVTLLVAAAKFLPRVTLAFAAATASYYLLERPLLSYARTFSCRPRPIRARVLLEREPSSIMEQ